MPTWSLPRCPKPWSAARPWSEPHSLLAVRTHRYHVSGGEALELGDDAARAAAPQVVEDVVAIPARSREPHLQQPRPDPLRSGGDTDRTRGVERGPGHELVTGQGTRNLLRGGAPRELPGANVPDVARDGCDCGGSKEKQTNTKPHHASLAPRLDGHGQPTHPDPASPGGNGDGGLRTERMPGAGPHRPGPRSHTAGRAFRSAPSALPAAGAATTHAPH
jgi:hypothetical protein